MTPTNHDHLCRQLRYIERSSRSYDEGFEEEAIRIAVALRVVFHTTHTSHSLLQQLSLGNSIEVLSTFSELDPRGGAVAISLGGVLSHTGIEPTLHQSTGCRFLAVEQWWNQVVHVVNEPYSRRDVVLAAANQDGGAHVDPSPSKKTIGLRAGVGTLTSTMAGGATTIRVLRDSHFCILRQLGYEVLHSPDLLTVAGISPAEES